MSRLQQVRTSLLGLPSLTERSRLVPTTESLASRSIPARLYTIKCQTVRPTPCRRTAEARKLCRRSGHCSLKTPSSWRGFALSEARAVVLLQGCSKAKTALVQRDIPKDILATGSQPVARKKQSVHNRFFTV